MDAFLETTAIVDILFKDKAVSDTVRSIAKKYDRTYTSQYVRMEIKRGVLQYFVALHNKSIECSSMAEVHGYAKSLSSTRMRNRLGTILEAIENVYKEVAAIELAGQPASLALIKKMVEAFLRLRIEGFWAGFDEAADVIIDETECYKRQYTLQPPRAVGKVYDNTLQKCDRYKPDIWRIRQFVNARSDSLVQIGEVLSSGEKPDPETVKRTRAIREALRLDPRDISQKLCWSLGDAIILLEAPDGATIVTHNCKHFKPMCDAVGRSVECY